MPTDKDIQRNLLQMDLEKSRADCQKIVHDLVKKHDALYCLEQFKEAARIAKIIETIRKDLI